MPTVSENIEYVYQTAFHGQRERLGFARFKGDGGKSCKLLHGRYEGRNFVVQEKLDHFTACAGTGVCERDFCGEVFASRQRLQFTHIPCAIRKFIVKYTG